jgi:hypothetical protein
VTSASSSPVSIGQRISYAWHPDALTVIITQEIPRRQRLMLEVWFAAWLMAGAGFGQAWRMATTADERMFFMICIAFWTYFAFRVGKVVLWRRMGQEMIRVNAEGVSIKNAFGTFGRAHFFLKDNIKRLEVVRRDKTKFLHTLDQSFWIIGGDALSFQYFRKSIVFGKQLSEREAGALAKVIDKALRKF